MALTGTGASRIPATKRPMAQRAVWLRLLPMRAICRVRSRSAAAACAVHVRVRAMALPVAAPRATRQRPRPWPARRRVMPVIRGR